MSVLGSSRIGKVTLNKIASHGKRKAKIQVPSVPCRHGTVQKKMAPTSSAISKEKLLGSDRKFPVFLDKSLPNLKKKPRRPLLGKMWPDKLAVKDGIFYRRL